MNIDLTTEYTTNSIQSICRGYRLTVEFNNAEINRKLAEFRTWANLGESAQQTSDYPRFAAFFAKEVARGKIVCGENADAKLADPFARLTVALAFLHDTLCEGNLQSNGPKVTFDSNRNLAAALLFPESTADDVLACFVRGAARNT